MNERENQWAQAQAFSDWMIVMRRALAEKEADAEELYRALTVETETLADCRDQANHQTQVNITLSRKLDRSEQALAEAHAAFERLDDLVPDTTEVGERERQWVKQVNTLLSALRTPSASGSQG